MDLFKALNDGEPWKMDSAIGIDEDQTKAETDVLENICLYCDSSFSRFLNAETLELKTL